MNLHELIESGPRTATGLLVDRHLAAMDQETRSIAEKLLRDPGYSSRLVAEALTGSGYKTSRSSVQEWRRQNKAGE